MRFRTLLDNMDVTISMRKAILIRANGEIEEVEPKNGTDFKLEELNKFVGGPIELARTKDGRHLVVNEQGLPTGLPHNQLATLLYVNGRYSHIVGDVLVCDNELIK